LTFVGINLFENNVDTVFAQMENANLTSTPTSDNNSNTTLATNQQQDSSSLHPQLVLIIIEEGKIANQRVLEVHPYPKIVTTFVAN
jgi:hypothetical protein